MGNFRSIDIFDLHERGLRKNAAVAQYKMEKLSCRLNEEYWFVIAKVSRKFSSCKEGMYTYETSKNREDQMSTCSRPNIFKDMEEKNCLWKRYLEIKDVKVYHHSDPRVGL